MLLATLPKQNSLPVCLLLASRPMFGWLSDSDDDEDTFELSLLQD